MEIGHCPTGISYKWGISL